MKAKTTTKKRVNAAADAQQALFFEAAHLLEDIIAEAQEQSGVLSQTLTGAVVLAQDFLEESLGIEPCPWSDEIDVDDAACAAGYASRRRIEERQQDAGQDRGVRFADAFA
jgi:hypothetical protein